MNVLLIGGYRPLMKVLGLALEEEGLTVDAAPDVQSGDDKARREEYDTIILDLIAPGDAPRCLTESWRRRSPNARVLVLSPFPAGAGAAAPGSRGDDWLTKPFGLDEFLTRVRALQPEAVLLKRRVAPAPSQAR
jgi:DNA-binding response OmpR family regulator